MQKKAILRLFVQHSLSLPCAVLTGVVRLSRPRSTEYKPNEHEQNASMKSSHTAAAALTTTENASSDVKGQSDTDPSPRQRTVDSLFSGIPRQRSFGRSSQQPLTGGISLHQSHSQLPLSSFSPSRSPSSPPTFSPLFQEVVLPLASATTTESSLVSSPPKLTERGGSDGSVNNLRPSSSRHQRLHSQSQQRQWQFYYPLQSEDRVSPPKVRSRSHSDNLRSVLESSSESVSTNATHSTNPHEDASVENLLVVRSEVSSQTDPELPSSTPDSYSSQPVLLNETPQVDRLTSF
jgi:hypothetical protein